MSILRNTPVRNNLARNLNIFGFSKRNIIFIKDIFDKRNFFFLDKH